MEAFISVYRVDALRDWDRKYRIMIDGVRAGKIGTDERVTFPVTPGVHDVRAAIDWSGSPVLRLTVAPGETVRLTVEPAGSAFQMWQAFTRQGYLKLTVS